MKLNISLYSWNIESNYLYDFESKDITESKLSIKKGDGNLYRILKKIEYSKDEINDKNYNLLARINKVDKKFTLNFNENSKEEQNLLSESQPSLVLRHSYSDYYSRFKIKVDDLIKLGKVVLQVKEIFIKEKEVDIEISKRNFNINHDIKRNQNKNKIKSPCRICFCDDDLDENPLICPCKCSGTMKFIHFECLKKWLKLKMSVKTYKFLTIFKFSDLECEICKTKISENLKIKNKVKSFIEIDNDCNYILFDCLSNSFAREEKSKTIYLVRMRNTNKVRLGRSHECEIRIPDISISRNHCDIEIFNDEFFIKDMNSKFGSSIIISSKIDVIPYRQLGLQIGKFLITFNSVRTFCGLIYCLRLNSKYLDYNKYLDENRIKMREIEEIQDEESKESLEFDNNKVEGNIKIEKEESISDSTRRININNEKSTLIKEIKGPLQKEKDFSLSNFSVKQFITQSNLKTSLNKYSNSIILENKRQLFNLERSKNYTNNNIDIKYENENIKSEGSNANIEIGELVCQKAFKKGIIKGKLYKYEISLKLF